MKYRWSNWALLAGFVVILGILLYVTVVLIKNETSQDDWRYFGTSIVAIATLVITVVTLFHMRYDYNRRMRPFISVVDVQHTQITSGEGVDIPLLLVECIVVVKNTGSIPAESLSISMNIIPINSELKFTSRKVVKKSPILMPGVVNNVRYVFHKDLDKQKLLYDGTVKMEVVIEYEALGKRHYTKEYIPIVVDRSKEKFQRFVLEIGDSAEWS